MAAAQQLRSHADPAFTLPKSLLVVFLQSKGREWN
jgi:hypothetical protein